MKRCLLLLITMSVLFAKAQNEAIINGTITGLKDGSKVYLVPNSLDNWRDSTVVRNGKFHFKISIPEGHSYNIRLSRGYETGKWKDFYVDEGVLNIKGRNGVFNNCTVSGSKFAQDFNDYNVWLESHDISNKLERISKQEQEAAEKKDTVLGEKLYQEYRKVDSFRTVLGKQWAAAHPASPISAYVLYADVRQNVSIEELEAALNNLFPEAKKNSLGKQMQAKVDAAKATAIGKIAPDFEQNDTSGNPVSLRDFRGKFLLIDFWASWCLPCREENPNLIAAFEKFKDKGFTVLSVSLDDDKNKWLQAIRKDNLLWTHVSDLKFWDNAVAKQYGIGSVPFNLLLDHNGKIIAKDLHGEELHKQLLDILQ